MAKRLPVSGTFELTPRCNLNCRMCYIHMSPDEQCSCGKELTTQQWLDIGKQAVEAGMVYLLLTGGEPLLRPDFLTIYMDMVRRGVKVSVNTNGSCINQEIADCFRRYPPEQVNITLYGASAETYRELCGVASGYEAARNGVRLLKEAGVQVNLNTTFTTCNLADMDALVAYAKAEELPIRTAAYVFPKSRNGGEAQAVALTPEAHGCAMAHFERLTMTDERFQKRVEAVRKCVHDHTQRTLASEKEPSSCMAGRGAFWVSWDGKMLPCGMLPEDSVDLLTKRFADAWDHTCRNMDRVFLPNECGECQYRPICPMCAALTQNLNGDYAAVPRQMCRYIQSYCKSILEMQNDLS